MRWILIPLIVLLLASSASAQWRFGDKVVAAKIVESSQGFAAVIDTVMANVNSNTYFKWSAPTGYRFQRIDVYLITPSEDSEACKIRFWYSSTDSTTINKPDGAMTIGLPIQIVGGSKYTTAQGDGQTCWQFPIDCAAVSVTEHADTDDFMMIGFLRPY